ncbi:MAG: hypothetical protein JXN64_11900 [Spirochaetes bacterium]|nr:hypothetical protein [Spirochaetota bacterium]
MNTKLVAIMIAIMFGLLSCGGGKSDGSQVKKSPENSMRGQETGYGTIYDNDRALARDRAIDDAMNKLVKKILGTTVSGRAIVEDFALIESIVEAQSTGMVRNWKILKEGAEQGTWVVTIEGEVYPQAVNDTIEATLRNYGRPKFMVLVRETFEGKANAPGSTVTELTMMDIMGRAGFEFVDAAVTQELMRKEKAKMTKAMTGAIGEDVQNILLADIGAEVIITGDVKTSDQSHAIAAYSKNMKSKSAIVNIKAVDVYTGRILASTSTNQPAVHIDNDTASKMAVQRCLQSVLGKTDESTGQFVSGPFMNQITRKFLESATRRMIMMNIAGLNYNDLTKFRNQIEHRVRGINKVYTRGQAGKYSKIEVEFAGKTTDLADELKAKGPNLGFQIEIKETYPNRIMLTATATDRK